MSNFFSGILTPNPLFPCESSPTMAFVFERDHHGIDEATAQLVFQLQLQEFDIYSLGKKGKCREGEISDEALAFQLRKEEMEMMNAFNADHRMARSMTLAVINDGAILTEALSQEDLACRDQEIARELLDGADLAGVEQPKTGSEDRFLEDEILEKLKALYVAEVAIGVAFEEEEDGNAESSQWASKRSLNPTTLDRRCEACRDMHKFFDVARAPCRHEYCRNCLRELFEMSMTDESLFPPRCCRQTITLSAVRIFLPGELVQAFKRTKVEFETPNRTYCHIGDCSSFITPDDIQGEVARCQQCHSSTCTTCKAEAHQGDCPNDTVLQQVLEMARENGWQRCYSCWRVVQLEHGCNHMM